MFLKPTPIHHTFAPLGDRRQCWQVFWLLHQPWRYRRGPAVEKLRQAVSERWHGDVSLFASGRQALLALLQSLDIRAGDEVIVQAYTCVVVPNAIRATGAKLVYVDIERETLNLDLGALEKAITPSTKVIICQHTFGIPADTKNIRELCDRHGIFFVEDCAHVLPDESGPSDIGRYGDALLFSFGRDKAISGVTGGAVVSRQKHVSDLVRQKESSASPLPWLTVHRLLNYPLCYANVRLLYRMGLGKIYAYVLRLTGILLPITTNEEKRGKMDTHMRRLPNACCALVLDQVRRLKQINDHRRSLVAFYHQEGRKRGWPILQGARPDLPLQKFPLFLKNAEKIRRVLVKENIFLDDGWTGCVVCPASVHIPDTGYTLGEDPEAEAVCEEILSLPTHPTMSMAQAERLVNRLHQLLVTSN